MVRRTKHDWNPVCEIRLSGDLNAHPVSEGELHFPMDEHKAFLERLQQEVQEQPRGRAIQFRIDFGGGYHPIRGFLLSFSSAVLPTIASIVITHPCPIVLGSHKELLNPAYAPPARIVSIAREILCVTNYDSIGNHFNWWTGHPETRAY